MVATVGGHAGFVLAMAALGLSAGCNQVLGIKDPVPSDATPPGDSRPDDAMDADIDAPPPCTTATAFGAAITSAVGGTGVALAVSKLDADRTTQDVAVSVTSDTMILPGNGDGTFGTAAALGTASTTVVAKDFDLVGVREDLLLVTATSAVVRLQKENGQAGVFDNEQALTGPFTNANAARTGELGNSSAVADVVIHDDAGNTPFLSLATAGTFSRGTTVGAGGDQLVAVAQIDKVDDADALLVDAAGNVKVALSNGTGGFSAPVTVATNATGRGVGIGDFDGDTLPDLIVATAAGGVVYLQNAGSPGTFVQQADTFPGIQGDTLLVGDVNGDGLDDVVVPTAVVLQCPTTRVFTQVEPIDATPPAVLADVTNNGKLDLLRLSGTDLIVRVQ